jgi:hypothetical protein
MPLSSGRSTSYLTTNDDLNETFASLFNNITKKVNCFDFIDANRFIPYINENQKSYTSAVRRNKLHKGKPLGNDYFR